MCVRACVRACVCVCVWRTVQWFSSFCVAQALPAHDLAKQIRLHVSSCVEDEECTTQYYLDLQALDSQVRRCVSRS